MMILEAILKLVTQNMPTPDNIITSGKLGYEMIQNGGYPKQKLSICGGLRYWTLLTKKIYHH